MDTQRPDQGACALRKEALKGDLVKKGARLEESDEDEDTIDGSEDESTITGRPATTQPGKSCMKQQVDEHILHYM